ncbi:MAG: hypothetical protein M3Y39_16980 [Chloroflexota bacterium]|nr:hypothetical protein [Chloroflexota bacterium]
MTKTYTFSECYKLLDVDPKTFGRWLEKASIDPKQQVSKVDNRIRYLTQQQVEQLATDHGRTLTPLTERTEEDATPGMYKLLAERLDTLESKLEEVRDDTYSARTEIFTSTPSRSEILDLETQLHDTRELLSASVERISALEEHLHQAQATIATLQAPRRATKGKSATDTTEALPEGLIPWRTFADLHKCSQTTAGRYIEQGFIHVVKGKWKIGNGYVKEALDAPGRHDFWTQFHNKDDFSSCDDCPHEIPQS